MTEKKNFSHLNEEGRARMVDVSEKLPTSREAVARASVKMKLKTLEAIKAGVVKKGDVLAVAQVAGVMAAKKTSELIPMCHPLQITNVKINFDYKDKGRIDIESVVKTIDRTGVEMEALVAASVAALTIYDMCK
ncbi:MAG: cyclic pyranopterin monophosphate synthase MoaC, partial [Candidatus Subteraquimicrobiales bacterium]|nr:cyclic pyranopterin monophosphate synthase MoaC [Candidatus Subteraquimicrobiales bacterium]